MLKVDMRTVILCYSLCSLSCASVMVFQWRAYRNRYAGLGYLAAQYSLQFIGLVLIMARGLLPDFLSISAANWLIALGYVFLFAGLRRFFSAKGAAMAEWAAFAVFAAAHAWFTYIRPDLAARDAVFSLIMVYFSARCITFLVRLGPGIRTISHSLIAVFSWFCLASLARIALILLIPPGSDFFGSDYIDAIVLMVFMGLFIALTFAILYMVGRRNYFDQEKLIAQKTLAEAAYRGSEERLTKSFQASPNAVAITTLDEGRFVEVNERFCLMLGYSREEVLGEFAIKVWPRAEARRAFVDRISASDRVSGYETSLMAKSGKEVHVEISACMIELEGRKHVLSIIRGLAERDRTNAILRVRLKLHEYAIGHTTEEVMVKALDEIEEMTGSSIGFYHFVDEDEKSLSLQAWSTRTTEVFCKAAGRGMHYATEKAGVWADCVRERKAIVHNDYASLQGKKGLPEGHAAVTRELVVPTFRGGRIVAILGVGNKAAEYEAEDVDLVSYIADLVWRIVVQKRSDEQIAKLNERLERLAMTDELTGLSNRRAFFAVAAREAQKAKRYGSPLSFIMLDVDFFKRVNDAYGHDAGDAALKAVAGVLRAKVRDVDVTARLGGEEFGILLPSTKAAAAASLAKRLLDAIDACPIEVEGNTIRITASLGVAESGGDAVDLDDLMKRADKAMYLAKDGGRNRVVVA